MDTAVSPLPDDVEALKALLSAATRRAEEAEAQLANAQARVSATEAMIAHIKLQIAKLRRERYGPSAERTRRLLVQMELQLEDLEADACEDDLAQIAKLSRSHDLTKAINYMLRRWAAFSRFLDDGRVCISNNAAERALRCVPLGRKAWLFCGSDRGGQRAAVLYTLIQSARLNDVDPQAWLADVLARIADHPARRLDDLLPWNWRKSQGVLSQAA